MRIIICGMGGFVGQALAEHLIHSGYRVEPLSIRPSTSIESITEQLDGADAIINLSGAPILKRWSKSYKKILRSSRIETTRKLVLAIERCAYPPQTLLNASAIGLYDSYYQHDEYSRYFSNDFLATLVQDWEDAALDAKGLGVRVCLMRFGVVYSAEGGAMAKMLPAFKLGLGGKMGDGFQMISWIHLDDLVRACAFLIEHTVFSGAVNFTTPEPICNLRQTNRMGHYLRRPTCFSLPGFLVKLVFGEGSSIMLDSKEVYPKVLQEGGFTFCYPTFDSAMEQISHGQK